MVRTISSQPGNGAEPFSLVALRLQLPRAFRISLAGGFLEHELRQDSQSAILRPCELLTSVLVPVIAFCLFDCVGGIGFEPTTSCMSSMRSNQLS